jgi:hypothetical protein
MFPQCANPECSESFSSFREGTFFRFRRTDGEAASAPGKHHAVEHAWLCAHCSEHYTADYVDNKIALLAAAPLVMPVVEEVLPSPAPMRARARAMRRRRPSTRRSSAQPPAANPMIVLAINPRGEFD